MNAIGTHLRDLIISWAGPMVVDGKIYGRPREKWEEEEEPASKHRVLSEC